MKNKIGPILGFLFGGVLAISPIWAAALIMNCDTSAVAIWSCQRAALAAPILCTLSIPVIIGLAIMYASFMFFFHVIEDEQ